MLKFLKLKKINNFRDFLKKDFNENGMVYFYSYDLTKIIMQYDFIKILFRGAQYFKNKSPNYKKSKLKGL